MACFAAALARTEPQELEPQLRQVFRVDVASLPPESVFHPIVLRIPDFLLDPRVPFLSNNYITIVCGEHCITSAGNGEWVMLTGYFIDTK